MPVYFVAQITIRDPEEYQKYIDRAGEVFKEYKGTYLAADDRPLPLEGSWDRTRMVIIQFEDRAGFEAWYRSAEYQEILKFRLRAADCDSVLVSGIG